MGIQVVKVEKNESSDAVFVNLLFDLGGGSAFISRGWKIYDNRIFPPDKTWKGKSYQAILVSPGTARMVQAAIEAAKIEGVDLDPDAWVSAKWGQASLKHAGYSDEAAMELWSKYRER